MNSYYMLVSINPIPSYKAPLRNHGTTYLGAYDWGSFLLEIPWCFRSANGGFSRVAMVLCFPSGHQTWQWKIHENPQHNMELVGGFKHEWIIFHFIKKGCHPKPVDEVHHFSRWAHCTTNQGGFHGKINHTRVDVLLPC